MKELLRLVKSEEAMYLLEEIQEMEKCFEAKSWTEYEEQIKKDKEKEMLKRIKEIMKGGE